VIGIEAIVDVGKLVGMLVAWAFVRTVKSERSILGAEYVGVAVTVIVTVVGVVSDRVGIGTACVEHTGFEQVKPKSSRVEAVGGVVCATV